MASGDIFLQYLGIFWDFQNLQRAKLAPPLAFLVFKSCIFFFFFEFSCLALGVFKVCAHTLFLCGDAGMSEKCRDCIS